MKIELHWHAFEIGDLFNGISISKKLGDKVYQVVSLEKPYKDTFLYTIKLV